MAKKSPNPIDAHVGARLRLRRMLIGMSQERLAGELDLTFQQIQKYEKGLNRIGAGRLFEIARALDTDIQYFFDDLASGETLPEMSDADETRAVNRVMSSPEGMQLMIAFARVKDPATRRRISELVQSLAEAG